MKLRSMRRDRAARRGPELFLVERAFADCIERIEIHGRKFARAVLIGCPDPQWSSRIQHLASAIDRYDPGELFARWSDGEVLIEDSWLPPEQAFDLVISIGTLDTVNDLPLALRLIRHSMAPDGLFIGAFSGGDTLRQLRNAMREADSISRIAVPHIHPRIEAAAVAPLLEAAGFVRPVVDVDRVLVSYQSLDRLVSDLRAMAASNLLIARPRFLSRAAKSAAASAFLRAGDGRRTIENFEIVHFAAWTANAK